MNKELEQALFKSDQSLTLNSSLLVEQKNLNLSLENEVKKRANVCVENEMRIEELSHQVINIY